MQKEHIGTSKFAKIRRKMLYIVEKEPCKVH